MEPIKSESEVQAIFDETHDSLPLKMGPVLIIVGGGSVDLALLAKLAQGAVRIIAADGGAQNCALAGVLPEAIIGDIDSLEALDEWADKVPIYRFADQMTTDFEKCIYATQAQVTLALGMTGKRLDHTLATLETMTRYALTRHVILVDEEDIALAVCGAFSFEVAAGGRVSIHPLARVGFAKSSGLEYALHGVTLGPGIMTGTSNSAFEGPFSITPIDEDAKAPWLLIVAKSYLDRLLVELVG